MVRLAPLLHGGSEHQHAAVDNGDGIGVEIDGNRRTAYRPDGRGDFQEHAEADIGNALLDVCAARTAGRGNGSHERSAYGVVEVHAEAQCQHGDNHHAAAQARERAEQAGAVRSGKKYEGKSQYCHC